MVRPRRNHCSRAVGWSRLLLRSESEFCGEGTARAEKLATRVSRTTARRKRIMVGEERKYGGGRVACQSVLGIKTEFGRTRRRRKPMTLQQPHGHLAGAFYLANLRQICALVIYKS